MKNAKALSYDNALWLVGGSDEGTVVSNKVWRSLDNGMNWIEITPSADLTARDAFGFASAHGKMWIIAGNNATTSLDDILWSTDGATWTTVTQVGTALAARKAFNAVS